MSSKKPGDNGQRPNAYQNDSNKAPIETVFIGDDDEDIICEDVIICDKKQADPAANTKAQSGDISYTNTNKACLTKDLKAHDISSAKKPTPFSSNEDVKIVEPMEIDAIESHHKPANVSRVPSTNNLNGRNDCGSAPQNKGLTRAKSEKKVPENVVELSDDNDEPEVLAGGTVRTSRKSRADRSANTCINFNCKSGDNLSKAAAFVLTHYGLKNKRNKQQEVCAECFEIAVKHQEKIADRLTMNKCLLDTSFPRINDSVIVLDSDEEGSDVEEALRPDVLQSIDELLPGVMDGVLKKYDLDYHVSVSQTFLADKLSHMELNMEKINKDFDDTQKMLDEWRAKIYLPYQPIVKNIESVEIVDAVPINSSPPGLSPISGRGSAQNSPSNQIGGRVDQDFVAGSLAHRQHQIQQQHQQLQQQQQQRQQQIQQHRQQQQQNRTLQHQRPQQRQQQQQQQGNQQRLLQRQQQQQQQYQQQQQRQQQQRQQQLQQQQLQQQQKLQQQQQQRHQAQTRDAQQNLEQSLDDRRPPPVMAVKKPGQNRVAQPRTESQEVVALEDVPVTHEPLPPVGHIRRPRPRVDDLVYVMKTSFFGAWATGRIMEVITKPDQSVLFKVRMDHTNRRAFSMKTVTGRHLAYPKPSPVLLSVGTRVIAIFEDDDTTSDRPHDLYSSRQENYYAGLIVEPPKNMNKYRYLVFFDDGYAQYVKHERILLVCDSSRNVWEDIHPKSRDFIRSYLDQYPERPMVKLQPGQVVKTEWDGKWWIARVVQVDGSLVKMHFDADDRTEWIYRGSTRLAPLYAAQAQAQARAESGTMIRMRGFGMATLKKPNTPYVEYTRSGGQEDERPSPAAAPVRAVAKKSTSKRTEVTISNALVQRTPSVPQHIPEGHVQEIRLPVGVPLPKMFVPHQCGPNCIEWVRFNRDMMYTYNPLSIPLLCGWQRELLKFRGKRAVMYTAPCGRRLRNMQELHRYLRLASSTMTVDLFDFDPWVHALAEYVLISDRTKKPIDIKIQEEDLSMGAEKVFIPLVNYFDHTRPNFVKYSTKRMPTEGVPLEREPDPEFLCGCDCTDDCQDKEKCACWQLTIEGTALQPPGVVDPTVGYMYRRLPDRVITGIYECNSRCKCSNTCLNRVVQHPLQLKLQLFKTPDKGWGIRCINDIPQGTFICIYAGELLTEQKANEEGAKYGDDYLAELDYIEVVERMKEGYESDVEDDFMDQDDEEEDEGKKNDKSLTESSPDKNSDEDFNPYYRVTKSANSKDDSSIRSRLRKRVADEEPVVGSKTKDDDAEKRKRLHRSDVAQDKGNRRSSNDDAVSDDDEPVRVPKSFTAQPVGIVGEPKKPRLQSVRKSFGARENVYIMDANHMGNIGRYLNHSCSPNVFVQNVFVDTHDLRFPWVAFFALTYIRAGTELTWDYSYDVGSVPDKQIQCRCGSSECRGRLI